MNTVLDILEVAVSCAYATWLRKHKDIEPKMTFLEVIFGTAYTLTFSTLRGVVYGGSWWDQTKRITRDFALSSIPIVVGEVEQWVDAQRVDRAFEEEHRT